MQLTTPIIILSTFILLTSGRLVPQRKYQAPRRKGPINLPLSIREPGQTELPELHIPNPKFCEKMALQPAMHYMVLPWWYNYCARLKDIEDEKLRRSGRQNLQMYSNVLNYIKTMKKYVKI